MSNLNQRCEQILSILTHERGYVSLRRLSEKTGVSRRSIYYDICKMNGWVRVYPLPRMRFLRKDLTSQSMLLRNRWWRNLKNGLYYLCKER